MADLNHTLFPLCIDLKETGKKDDAEKANGKIPSIILSFIEKTVDSML